MIELKDLNVYYGAIHALQGINLKVEQGEIVTLIGANGAGKTTTLKTISGILKPKSGKVIFDGKDINKLNANEIVSLGVSHVPEGRRVFKDMSIMENLEMGAYSRKDKGEIKQDYEKYEDFSHTSNQETSNGRNFIRRRTTNASYRAALMARPKLLLLDEPSMGLAPLAVKQIFSIIEEINKSGTTILLGEQNATMALKIASRAYVIQHGSIEMRGSC